VKFASSSNAPLVPTITTLLSVRSVTIALFTDKSVPSYVKFASSSKTPFVPAITTLLSVKFVDLILPASIVPFEPETTSPEIVASGTNVQSLLNHQNPRKQSFQNRCSTWQTYLCLYCLMM